MNDKKTYHVRAPMQVIGTIGPRTLYWAAPGEFDEPGLYCWDGEKQFRIDLDTMKPTDAEFAGYGLSDSPSYTPQEMAASFRAGQNAERMQGGTPSSQWAANNEPDPHGGQYDCERAALTLGHLTDDALANDVFLHGDQKPSAMALASGVFPAITYLTAAKDRIRWLSRALVAATGKQQVGEVQGDGLATIIAALEHSKPTHDHYPEPVKRHADALAHARALAARQPVGQEPDHIRDVHDVEQGLIRNPKFVPPAQAVDLGHSRAIELLLTVAEAAYNLADNANDMEDCENVEHADFVALSDALDALDELPDDRPNYTMTEPAKARWALRGLIYGGKAVQS